MEDNCRVAQRLEFPLSDEEDLHEASDCTTSSIADTNRLAISSRLSDRLDSSGSDEGLGMSIPHFSPRKPRFVRSKARDTGPMSPPYSGVRALRLFDSPATPKTLLENCHAPPQMPVTPSVPVLATPAPARSRTRTLFTMGSVKTGKSINNLEEMNIHSNTG